MGPIDPDKRPNARLDEWLRTGGRVVASSDRAARAVLTAYHHARRAEGQTAWLAPAVQSWQAFVQEEWQHRTTDSRLVMNAWQEESFWAQAIQQSRHGAALLDGPLRRLAALAGEAHDLLCAYSPRYLSEAARRDWQQDAAAFSGWLKDFDAACRTNEAVSGARMAVEFVELLKSDSNERSPILLVGFDRLTPMQQSVLAAWGEFHTHKSGPAAGDIAYVAAADTQAELSACAAWCRQQLEINPDTHLLVVTQDAKLRRGEIERAFSHQAARNSSVRLEFSLGVPLQSVAVVRSALLLLQWLDGALEEHELDWLFSTTHIGTSRESAALQTFHRELRRRGQQRTQWTLETWLRQKISFASLPETWTQRMREAQRLLRANAKGRLSPLEWSALAPRLLAATGWPESQYLSSEEFQALRRWEQALDAVGSLGWDGRRTNWQSFLTDLRHVVQTTLFSPESEDAPILIAGPAESAGVTADAIWFLGADEDAWPARSSPHPLLPPDVQRNAKMPHSAPQLDADLAAAITTRLLSSAPTVRFSYARQKEEVETRASRLVTQIAGPPRLLPAELMEQSDSSVRVEQVPDTSRIPLRIAAREGEVHGGSSVLTAQSQCPFQAFATARLDARSWDAAEVGLTAAERGNLLHEVMHAIWGGPETGGIRTSEELSELADVQAFVTSHVKAAISMKVPPRIHEHMPARYIELETTRLVSLVTGWLNYEKARLPFSVKEIEVDSQVTIAGLTLKLRLDRVDELNDGSLLVIDYKTGDVGPRQWNLPRPEDVQLPLYAGFALPEESELGGLAFAKLRPGENGFAGCIGDARSTLFPTLTGTNSLVRNQLTAEQLLDWREAIEQLARDFLAGNANVDPRDFPGTCENCGLQAVCRVYEQDAALHEAQEEAAYDAE